MEHKKISAAILLLILIIIGMFVYTYLKKNELNSKDEPSNTIVKDTESKYGNIIRIDAKHFYTNPSHIIIGEIVMPTPCDLLNWNTRILESYPEQVIVDFSVVNHADSCAQVVTGQRFKVTFDASENAIIRAMIEGREVELNLIPALPGESADDFELFIKG